MKQLLLYISSIFIGLALWAQPPGGGRPGGKDFPGGKSGGDKSDQKEEMIRKDTADMPKDTLVTPTDSAALKATETAAPIEKIRPFRPSVMVDYGKLATTAVGWSTKYEATLNLLFFEHYYLAGEYGYGSLNPKAALSNGSYTSEGTYYRIGGGIFGNISPGNYMGLGLRYGLSNYSEKGDIYVESASGIQGDYTSSYQRDNLQARWMEIVLSSESTMKINKKNASAPINNRFALGFNFRFKIMGSYEHFSPIDTYTIPGYGRTANSPNLALNLYLKMYIF